MSKFQENKVIIRTKLRNYYGEVSFNKEGDVYYMGLDNWDGNINKIEITEQMFLEAEKLWSDLDWTDEDV